MVIKIKRISGHMSILIYSHSQLLTHILEYCMGGGAGLSHYQTAWR